MAWPEGTVVEHKFLGTYTVAGELFTNDIGNLMVPVVGENGTLTYFNPQNLQETTAESRGDDVVKANSKHRPKKSNLPEVQETLF